MLQYVITLKDNASAALGRVGDGFTRLPGIAGGAIRSIGRGLTGLIGTLTSLPALIGGAAITAAATKAINLFGAQEQAAGGLRDSLRLAGDASTATYGRLIELSEALQKTTTHGDETTQAVMALGLNLGVPRDQIEAVTKAAIGLAEKTGMDLTTAMQLFGRTAQGASGQLARYGIVLDDTGSHQDRLNQLIEVGGAYFGLAEARAERTAGKIQQLKNAIGDLWEKLGDAIDRVVNITGTIDRLKTIVENVKTETLVAGLQRIVQVARLVGTVVAGIRQHLANLAQSEFAEKLATGFKSVLGIIQSLADGTTTFGKVLGQLGDLAGTSLKLGFLNAINALASGLQIAVAGAFGLIQQASFWSGLANVAMGAFTGLGAFLIKIFTAPLDIIEAGINLLMQDFINKIAGMGGAKDETGTGRMGRALGLATMEYKTYDQHLGQAQEKGFASTYSKNAEDEASALTKQGADQIAHASKAAAEAASKAFVAAEDLFDTTAARAAAAGARAQLAQHGDRLDLSLPTIPARDRSGNIEPAAQGAPATAQPAADARAADKPAPAAKPSEKTTADIGTAETADWMRAVQSGQAPEDIAKASRTAGEQFAAEVADAAQEAGDQLKAGADAIAQAIQTPSPPVTAPPPPSQPLPDRPVAAAAQPPSQPLPDRPVAAAPPPPSQPLPDRPVAAAAQPPSQPLPDRPVAAAAQPPSQPLPDRPVAAAPPPPSQPLPDRPVAAAPPPPPQPRAPNLTDVDASINAYQARVRQTIIAPRPAFAANIADAAKTTQPKPRDASEQIAENTLRMREILELIAKAEGVK